MEPKFKIGDILRDAKRFGGHQYKIINIDTDSDLSRYELSPLDGSTKYLDEQGKMWFSVILAEQDMKLDQEYMNEQKLKKVLGL